jgi:hypothetical protein
MVDKLWWRFIEWLEFLFADWSNSLDEYSWRKRNEEQPTVYTLDLAAEITPVGASPRMLPHLSIEEEAAMDEINDANIKWEVEQ